MNFGVLSLSQRFFPALIMAAVCCCLNLPFGNSAHAQDDSLIQAMDIKPKQKDVDIDVPTKEDLKGCKIEKSAERYKVPGFVVYDPSGRVLRQFFDNNKDGKLDQWSYFKNGIEVYRDVDTDFDRKADQYRWLGSGGTRWGIDADEDGVVDSWKVISAEEVAQEALEAIRDGDQKRFARLLLTQDEFASLKLGKAAAERIKNSWQNARKNFSSAVAGPLKLGKDAKFVNWGGGRPSMCPAGFEGNGLDVVAYDHASALYEAKNFGQVALGSIVNVGSVWRLVELPELVKEGKPISNGGLLFPLPDLADLASAGDSGGPIDDTLSKLYEAMDKVEGELEKAKGAAVIAKLESQKADILVSVYEASDKDSKQDWLENIADSVSSAYLDERFPDGLEFLGRFTKTATRDKTGVDYIAWRSLFSKYSLSMKLGDNKDRSKAQDALLTDLEDFVDRYPASKFAPEGMFQLALNSEMSNRDDLEKAVGWYKTLAKAAPASVYGQRAKGAITRLTSQGKPIELQGKTASGRPFTLSNRALRGKIVVLHYWESWCDDGFDDIERLAAKYKEEVIFVGCNIERTTADFQAYMKKNKNVTWTQLHAPGGVEESPLAIQLGVATEPLVMIIDSKGNLIESNLAFGDLERAIQREISRSERQARKP